jgi:hypothetical protein
VKVLLLLSALLMPGVIPNGLTQTANTYSTWDGSNLNEVSGDPSAITPDHWEIWLYRANTAHTMTNRWGAVSKPTLSEADSDLKSGQVFEKRWEKFTGLPYGPTTSFNPSEPIACLKPLRPAVLKQYLELNENYEKLSTMRDSFHDALDLSGTFAASEKGPLTEYLNALKTGIDNAAQIYERLSRVEPPDLDPHGAYEGKLAPPLMRTSLWLAKEENFTRVAEEKRSAIQDKKVATDEDGIPALDGSTGWMHPHRAGYIHQEITISGAGITVTEQIVDAVGSQTYVLPFDDFREVYYYADMQVTVNNVNFYYDNEKDQMQFCSFIKSHAPNAWIRAMVR